MKVELTHVSVNGVYIVGEPLCGYTTAPRTAMVTIAVCDKVSFDGSACAHGGTYTGPFDQFEVSAPHAVLDECPRPSCYTRLPEPPDGAVIIDDEGIAWQRRDAASRAHRAEQRWQSVGSEETEVEWTWLRKFYRQTVYVPMTGTVDE